MLNDFLVFILVLIIAVSIVVLAGVIGTYFLMCFEWEDKVKNLFVKQ